jgi:AcrR family transcriptional regulator
MDLSQPPRPGDGGVGHVVLYAAPAMTMKGIAERAGVGRQTVYRWWSTQAEILFEATITGATYRALLGEAQHDPAVAAMLATHASP